MPEALQQVKDDLGPDAVILNTRHVKNRRLDMLGKGQVEVTAALDDTERSETVPERREPDRPLERPNLRHEPPVSFEALSEEISEIKRSILTLERRVYPSLPGLPRELGRLMARLLDLDVERSVVEMLVGELLLDLSGKDLKDRHRVSKRAVELLREALGGCGEIVLNPSGPKVVSLVGPTGVGKTTAAAKIASVFRKRRAKISFIAVESTPGRDPGPLQSFAKSIGVPIALARTPAEMARTLRSFGDADLILVDTDGLNPYDGREITALADLLGEAESNEVHLVLSATTGFRDMLDLTEAFRAVSADLLLVTKTDEARRFGPALSTAIRMKKGISYLTGGRVPPGQLKAADPEELAEAMVRKDGMIKNWNENCPTKSGGTASSPEAGLPARRGEQGSSGDKRTR